MTSGSSEAPKAIFRFERMSLPRALPFLFALCNASGTEPQRAETDPNRRRVNRVGNEPLEKLGHVIS